MGLKGFPDFSALATAYVFSAKTGQIIRTFTPGGDIFIRCAAWSPDGAQIAAGLFDGTIVIWDYATGQKITTIVASDKPEWVDTIVWSPDGSKIGADVGDSAASAQVWDTHTWKPLFTVQHEPPTFVVVASWSPDGRRLLTTSGNPEQGAKDTTARIWDGATGKELLVFRGHSSMVWSGDWSPDGKRIATASKDVRVWDAATGAELLTLAMPDSGARWSPDGRHLVVSGSLVTVWRVWQSRDELVKDARERSVIRELTPAERKQYGLP